jgi:hypothetical protein
MIYTFIGPANCLPVQLNILGAEVFSYECELQKSSMQHEYLFSNKAGYIETK